MKITVFGSSSNKTPEKYMKVARKIGELIAKDKNTLINGGGKSGCMKALTDACLENGGTVIGIILKKFADEGHSHPKILDMIITNTMRERKQKLMGNCDACIVLPGGPGTWEELWEFVVERQIGTHSKPIVLVNEDGFYNGLWENLKRAEEDGLLYEKADSLITIKNDAVSAYNSVIS